MTMFVDVVGQLVVEALAHIEVTSATPGQLRKRPDLWWMIIEDTGRTIAMKNGLSHYFFKLKHQMRIHCAEKSLIVSETFIDEQIVKLLAGSKTANMDQAGITRHVQNWIDGIDKIQQDDYMVLLPISRYHFRGKVDTPSMKVVKVADEEIESDVWPIPDVFKDKFEIHELVNDNETEVFAIVNTRANDHKSAAELAQGMVDKFVYAAKLIDPNTTVSSRKNAYRGVLMSHATYNRSKGVLGGSHTLLDSPPDLIQDHTFYDKFDKAWTALLGFLFDTNPTELQKSIIDALYWYGEVDVHRDSLVSQYLYCLIGLEKLLVPNYGQGKAKKFGLHASIVLNGSIDHAPFYEEYYKKRNSLVHEGPIVLYKEDVDSLRVWLREILLKLIGNATKFSDLKSYYKDVHGVEW